MFIINETKINFITTIIIILLTIMKQEVLNEISLVINKTIGTNITNENFYNKEYELEINGISINHEDINNYEGYLINELNNITLKWREKLTSFKSMFQNLSNIIQIDFSIDMEGVQDMDHMFYDCKNLISVNLKNFNTSSVKYMEYMFNNCSSLKELNISSFDTSSVIYMHYMFYGCTSLIELDLSNFNFFCHKYERYV